MRRKERKTQERGIDRQERQALVKRKAKICHLCVPGWPLSPRGAPTRARLDMLCPGSATTWD